MRKIYAFLGIVFLVGCLFIPLVSAVDDFVVYNTLTSGFYAFSDPRLYTEHPSYGSGASSVAYPFYVDAGEDGYLTRILVPLSRVGDPSLNVSCRLIGATTNVVTTLVPNATVYDTALTVWNSTVISEDKYSYTFTFNSTYTLLESTYYFAEIFVTGSGDTSNYIQPWIGSSSSGDIRKVHYYSLGGFTNYIRQTAVAVYANVDPVYYVEGGEPTPPPTAAPSGDGDATLEYWSDIISVWIFPLLMFLVPAFLGLKFLGQMGFIVGLNIGAILLYVVFPNYLWTIILIGVADLVFIMLTRK